MRQSFHRIAYEALDVCNAVDMATIDAAIRTTGLSPGSRALDIGCGNAAVAIRLADAFGLTVAAVDLDPAMADLARGRIAAAPEAERVTLHQDRSGPILTAGAPWDLIVAMGTTNPVGDGRRAPVEVLQGLADALRPGGWLLWGDVVWLREPSEPLRQIVELTSIYADHAGWQDAARDAGLTVVSAAVSDAAAWALYRRTMEEAVHNWLTDHPDDPDAGPVRARAGQVAMMMDFGQDTMGFGLYLLQRPG